MSEPTPAEYAHAEVPVPSTTPVPSKRQPREARHATRQGAIAVALAAVLMGLLFGISAHLSRSHPSNLGVDLPSLVAQRQDEIKHYEEEIQTLQQQVDQLTGALETPQEQTGYVPLLVSEVTGPGIQVELDDAPPDIVAGDRVNANSLVVHQQDVDAVMNALWSGGAEAMTVQGVRISPFTPVRCIGNVILVGGTAFGPPYRIEAIGDPAALSAAIDADQQLQIYQQYVSAFGMGWSVKTIDNLTFPPLEGGYPINYAKPQDQS